MLRDQILICIYSFDSVDVKGLKKRSFYENFKAFPEKSIASLEKSGLENIPGIAWEN